MSYVILFFLGFTAGVFKDFLADKARELYIKITSK